MDVGGEGDGTWVIVGASRGIGLEFVRQLLQSGHRVVAAVRNVSAAPRLHDLIASVGSSAAGTCTVEQCDVASDESIGEFIRKMQDHVNNGMRLGNVVLNAGMLKYPNRATEISFADFAQHLHTNTIGPIICAQKLLNLMVVHHPSPSPSSATDTFQEQQQPCRKLVFISSDSGSAGRFLDFEDGFGAYAASKSALNQMLRHMAAEIGRRREGKMKVSGEEEGVAVLAMHPGEVETDLANIELGWEVKGSIGPEESVSGMLKVIAEKGVADNGTFWCWDGRSHPW